MIKILVNTKDEKLLIEQIINNNFKDWKKIAIEQSIENYFDNIIQMEIMEQYDFGLENATKQALRHSPQILIIEKGER